MIAVQVAQQHIIGPAAFAEQVPSHVAAVFPHVDQQGLAAVLQNGGVRAAFAELDITHVPVLQGEHQRQRQRQRAAAHQQPLAPVQQHIAGAEHQAERGGGSDIKGQPPDQKISKGQGRADPHEGGQRGAYQGDALSQHPGQWQQRQAEEQQADQYRQQQGDDGHHSRADQQPHQGQAVIIPAHGKAGAQDGAQGAGEGVNDPLEQRIPDFSHQDLHPVAQQDQPQHRREGHLKACGKELQRPEHQYAQEGRRQACQGVPMPPGHASQLQIDHQQSRPEHRGPCSHQQRIASQQRQADEEHGSLGRRKTPQ